MSEELKKCPFCGIECELERFQFAFSTDKFVTHPLHSCILSGMKFTFNRWQRRFYEDTLNQRIDELQAKYDKKCEDYLDILKKNTALANDYAEEVSENVRLESENKALRLIAGSHSMSELRRNRIMAGWRRGDTLKNEVRHE